MPLELQHEVTRLVVEALGAGNGPTPPWLRRPGKDDCGDRWELVQRIYTELTDGAVLPDAMPPRERRVVDYVLVVGGEHRILEVDENQHCNAYRARTLEHYGGNEVRVAFPVAKWIEACAQRRIWKAAVSRSHAHPCSPAREAVTGSAPSETPSPTSLRSSTAGTPLCASRTSRSSHGFSAPMQLNG
jgi:hypothetical protein